MQKITPTSLVTCPIPLIIDKVKEDNPQILLVYEGKKGILPVFTVSGPMQGGTSLGTIFVKNTSKPEKQPWRWLGKVGDPKGLLRNDVSTQYTRKRKEMNLDSIREKLAYDLYAALGMGFFKVPKTRLSEQPLINDFMPKAMPYTILTAVKSGRIPATLRIMSRYVDGYQDFKDSYCCFKGGGALLFMEFVEKMHCPPTHLLTPDGDIVPLCGFMEMIAVGRALGDTDCLGGRGDNAGFVWVRKNGRIVGAETVKIDPGCAFNFAHDERSSTGSPNWVHNTQYKIAETKKLKDLKDLQVAQNYEPATLYWGALTLSQKESFLFMLYNAKRYFEAPDVLDYLFSRDAKFEQNEKVTFPRDVAEKFKNEMLNWLQFQMEIYHDELDFFCAKQRLKAEYLASSGSLTLPLTEKNFPVHQLFKGPIMVDSASHQPTSLEDLFTNQQSVLLTDYNIESKNAILQKIFHDWASGKLWKDRFDAVHYFHIEDFKARLQQGFNQLDPYSDELKKPKLVILDLERCVEFLDIREAANRNNVCILWMYPEEIGCSELDQIVKHTGFSDIQTKVYKVFQTLLQKEELPSADILLLARKLLKLIPPSNTPKEFDSSPYSPLIDLYIHHNAPKELRNVLYSLARAHHLQNDLPLAVKTYYEAVSLSLLQGNFQELAQTVDTLLEIDPYLQHLQTVQKMQILTQRHLYQLSAELQATKAELQTIKIELKELKENLIPACAFGRAKWATHFGDVGEEPQLPANINQILQGFCPIWPGKTVEQTHILTLIPAAVDGKPLNLETLGELIQSPKQGYSTKYKYCRLGEYQDNPEAHSYWILMSRDVLKGSRSEDWKTQFKQVEALAQKTGISYVVPKVREAAISILMHHVSIGEKLYRESPWTFTRCKEFHSTKGEGKLVVGGFSSDGLGVDGSYYDFHGRCGVGVVRKL